VIGCTTSTTNLCDVDIQAAINGLTGGGGSKYMVDKSGAGVSVSLYQRGAIVFDASLGVYIISYKVTFNSMTTRGKVAPLTVQAGDATMKYNGGTGTFLASYPAVGPTFFVGSGGLSVAGSTAYVVTAGNQPSGYVKLKYTCESTTWHPTQVSVDYPGNVVYISQAAGATALSRYMFIRIQTTYHQIVGPSMDSVTKKQAIDGYNNLKWQIYPPFRKTGQLTAAGQTYSFNPYSSGDAADLQTGSDYGYYYSDPTAANGVSTSCLGANQFTTLEVYPQDGALNVVNRLRGLTSVINQDADSITVTRAPHYPVPGGPVGYMWSITFAKQHGDVPVLGCITTYLTGTTPACAAATVQHGSMITGNFTLGQTFPHVYQGTPVAASSSSMPWNINAQNMSSVLSKALAADGTNLLFGSVSVARVAYIPPGQKRWAGGFLWTIQFLTRNGQLPAITHTTMLNMMNGNESAVWLETATQTAPFASDPTNIGAQGSAGTAITGNQVQGHFGLVFTDQTGTTFTSAPDAFPILSPTTGHALSAAEMQARLNLFFNNMTNVVRVNRSTTFNNVMCYFYRIEYIGKNVGGAVMLLQPNTKYLSTTAVANTALQVGVPCTDDTTCTLGSYVVKGYVAVSHSNAADPRFERVGAQLQGSFQLRFNGFSTPSLAYNVDAQTMQTALNNLASIAPSRVVVTRDGPMITPSTQVFGYVWSITFTSNTWVDPTIDHTTYVPGNWYGAPTTLNDVWPGTPYSKAWGKNVGPQNLVSCLSQTSLFTTNGQLPPNGCQVEEVVQGTPPLSGTFQLQLNSTGHPVINYQGRTTSLPIAHNAYGNVSQSGGDGTSMQERLMAMNNIGQVAVTRSVVNPKNGGYTWTITFLRDGPSASGAKGQWGKDCQQRDSFYNLCNSPGDVPGLTFVAGSLGGGCRSENLNGTVAGSKFYKYVI